MRHLFRFLRDVTTRPHPAGQDRLDERNETWGPGSDDPIPLVPTADAMATPIHDELVERFVAEIDQAYMHLTAWGETWDA